MGIKENFQDVPQHEAGLTSSVGGLWPPERASFERIKGIYTEEIITIPHSLFHVINELYTQGKEHFRKDGSGVSRISFRAVVDNNLLWEEAKFLLDSEVEAVIPLTGTQEIFMNTSLVYLGLNHTTRQPLPGEIKRFKEMLASTDLMHGSCHDVHLRVIKNGYEIATLPEFGDMSAGEQHHTIDQVSQLYQRFGWERDDVMVLLQNPNNIMVVARQDDRIVSAGIAEMAKIPIGKNTLRIAEITEAATVDGFGGQGLYTAVSTQLLYELASRSQRGDVLGGEIDVTLGECNGNAIGVLRTARRQGRTFSAEIGKDYGFPNGGILPQHVPIEGEAKLTPYNDLFPAFMVRQTLHENYRKI